MSTFAWPLATDFMNGTFEQRPLHIRGVLPTGYFSVKDLNAALSVSAGSILPFTIGMHGRVPGRNEYCSEFLNPINLSTQIEIDPEKVENLLARGANIQIQRFASASEKVFAIVQDVERWLAFPTSANGYFSFGKQQGLPTHWDSHDIVAVQLIGKKNWKIFRPTVELPVRANRGHEISPPRINSECMEVQLDVGDALYVPRGWWHDVTPADGQRTLHLSVGLYPPNTSDFVHWLVNEKISSEVAFRKSLLRGAGFDATELLKSLEQAFADPQVLDKYRRQFEASARLRKPFNIDS